MAGFILIALRGAVTGYGIGDAIAAFAFASLYGFNLGYTKWMDYNKKPDFSQEFNERLQNLESKINVLQMTNGIRKQAANDDKTKRIF